MGSRAALASLSLALALAAGAGVSCGEDPSAPGLDAATSDARTGADGAALEDASSPALPDARAGVDARAGLDGAAGGCPAGMVPVQGFCIDAYEAHVVEVDDAGLEHAHSPYAVIAGARIRAKVAPGVAPQGYISQVEAAQACARAGKRLCSGAEFRLACEGPDGGNWYPYGGQAKVAGACNEGKGSSLPRYYGSDPARWTYAAFNDPRLNQWDGGLFPTGSFPRCVSPFGVYDCVGNLHEWGDDPPDSKNHGRFRGGFYGDAEINGHGCLYVTSAHEPTYHDYSTGFRCCADLP